MRRRWWWAIGLVLLAGRLWAQSTTGELRGRVVDETGGVLPGVVVTIAPPGPVVAEASTDGTGDYVFQGLTPGRYQVSFALANFGSLTRRDVVVVAGAATRVDAALHLALSAEVTVTRSRTFTNLADANNPAQDLVGIAQSASQGAITLRQIETRPISRAGEILEAVPGLIISQHSGEGKANQYYLRGFNLDHGTDFATSVAGIPVNMPTHAHGQGYSDLSFLIPELVGGVQFSKGPYFADQGDFATAGAAAISYLNVLDRPLVRFTAGTEGYSRMVVGVSPVVLGGHLLVAGELNHNDGPWDRPDDFRKVNGLIRYTRGDSIDAFSITAMGYAGKWNATDQIPRRAISEGVVDRFGTIDPTDGGRSSRFSVSTEWQRGGKQSLTKVSAFALSSDLQLFSNFTYFLDDPVRGDQFEQRDRRLVAGARIAQQRFARWNDRAVKVTFGAELRHDDILELGLFHTEARQRLETRADATALETSSAGFAQAEVAWTPWLRTLSGVRADEFRFHVDAARTENSGTDTACIVSPKLGVVLGPWKGSELYANSGSGYHSNDARGVTITRDFEGHAVNRVTPLVRANAAEVGVRSVALRRLQTTVSAWWLALDSELVFAGDAGTTENGRPSRRHGVEWTNYYTPRPWLILDADLSWSQARFADFSPAGDRVPGSVRTVASVGTTVEDFHQAFGSLRWRYFGPRPLVEDGSVQSQATSLLSVEAGYKPSKKIRVAVDVFNLLNSPDSDIDYFYTSRLPGEPIAGVGDVHLHPVVPRTARVTATVGF